MIQQFLLHGLGQWEIELVVCRYQICLYQKKMVYGALLDRIKVLDECLLLNRNVVYDNELLLTETF